MSAVLDCSHKHLIAEFHRYIGLAPRRFVQIRRFGDTLRTLNSRALGAARPAARVRSRLLDWTDLALSCDYYDQAHFNRDFRRFSGVTPRQYLELRAAIYGARADDTPEFVPAQPAR